MCSLSICKPTASCRLLAFTNHAYVTTLKNWVSICRNNCLEEQTHWFTRVLQDSMNSAKHLDRPKTCKKPENNGTPFEKKYITSLRVIYHMQTSFMFWTRSYLEDHPNHYPEEQSYIFLQVLSTKHAYLAVPSHV